VNAWLSGSFSMACIIALLVACGALMGGVPLGWLWVIFAHVVALVMSAKLARYLWGLWHPPRDRMQGEPEVPQ